MTTAPSICAPLGRPRGIGFGIQDDGQAPPLTGWTGLWLFPGLFLLIPAIVWFVKAQGALNDYWQSEASAAPAPSVTA